MSSQRVITKAVRPELAGVWGACGRAGRGGGGGAGGEHNSGFGRVGCA